MFAFELAEPLTAHGQRLRTCRPSDDLADLVAKRFGGVPRPLKVVPPRVVPPRMVPHVPPKSTVQKRGKPSKSPSAEVTQVINTCVHRSLLHHPDS